MSIQKHWAVAVLVLALLGPATLALAQQAPEGAAAYKVGVVDRMEVLRSYKRGKEEIEKLEGEVDKRQAIVDELKADIEAEYEQFQKDKDSMSEEAREEFLIKRESDITHCNNELKRLQRDIDNLERSMMMKLAPEINAAVEKVAAEGNYHLVFDGGPESKAFLVYFSTTLDITQKVVEHLDTHAAP